MSEIRNIAVVGAGAVGCYYGAKLAFVRDTTFLMRRDLEAVRASGLRIESPNGDLHLDPVRAFATTEEIGPVDLVVVALKTTANEVLSTLLPPLLHEGTAIVTLQNGLGNEALLTELCPNRPILGGMCFVCINRGEPGVVRHLAHGKIEMGEATETGTAPAIVALFQEAGIDCRLLPDLDLARWRKLVWNVPFNGLSIAAGGVDTREILAARELTSRVRTLMAEIIAIAAAEGHEIKSDFAEANIEGTRQMGPYKPSSLIDWENGSAVEVEAIWGKPLARARAAGVDTPELARLYREILARTSQDE